MTAAIVAFATAVLLIASTPARAQEAGTAVPGTAPARGEPTTPPPRERPKLRDQLLLEIFNAATKPRPEAPAPEPAATDPAPAPAEPVVATDPAAQSDAPPRPASAGAAAPTPKLEPAALPRPVRPPPAPRQTASAAPPLRAVDSIEPAPQIVAPAVPQMPTIAVEPATSATPVVPAAEPVPPPSPEPVSPASNDTLWYLLGLIVAAVAVAAGVQIRRILQISRTRAALALTPSLDHAAGLGSVSGLALSGPSIAIRARLDMTEPLHG